MLPVLNENRVTPEPSATAGRWKYLKLTRRTEVALLYLVGAILLWMALAAWFNPLQFRFFAGDDLHTFSRTIASDAPPIRSAAIVSEKFRPVALSTIFFVTKWTGGDFRAVASVGLALHAANAMLFFLLLHRVLRVPLVISLGLTLVAAFNRFATYLLMQDEALMEGIGIALFLLLLIAALSFLERPRLGAALWATLLFALVVYTHERYLVLAAPLVGLAVIRLRGERFSSLVLGGGVILAAASYFVVKRFMFNAPVLVGTGGHALAFDPWQIVGFFTAGVLNVVGINFGPAYLSLEHFPDSPFWVQALSVLAALLSIGLLAGAVVFGIRRRTGIDRVIALARIAFLLLSAAGLLLAASVTVRQEFRWLYPGFLAFVILLASEASRRRPIVRVLLVWLALASICRELYLWQRLPRFFAFEAYQIANNLASTLERIEGGTHSDQILIRGLVPHSEWIFEGDTFSRLYRLPTLKFEAANAPLVPSRDSQLVLDYNHSSRQFRVKPRRVAGLRQGGFGAVQKVAEALAPDDRWATPAKKPVFVTVRGGVDCVAVVAPVEFEVPIPPGSKLLHVTYSHLFPVGDGAELEIKALGDGVDATLLARRVPPLTSEDQFAWRAYELPLPAGARQIRLRLFSTDDPVADWIGLRSFFFE